MTTNRWFHGTVWCGWLFFALCCGSSGGKPLADAGTDIVQDADANLDADTLPEIPDCFEGIPPGDLPERIVFRTRTTSFNRQWFVALHEGKIWVKPNTDTGHPAGSWRLLGSGLPAGADVSRFAPPTSIVEISADGTWLHAISSAGVLYRGTDFTDNIHDFFTWSDAWGHPGATGPGITTEFPTTHGWAVSDSQRDGVHHYEDRLGTPHSVGLGVAHLYRLGPDGRSLIFNDWWLPADWSRQICLPNHGSFQAVNMSASGSTVFLAGTLGELYTRLYDFDTAGENDTLEYSFLISQPSGNTRALPAEPWLRQPDIPDGLITDRISIAQNGQGNAGRQLRVEGVRQGRTGYFEKQIFDATWTFVETGHTVCGPFLNAPGRLPPEPFTPDFFPLQGELVRSPTFGQSVSVEVDISAFFLFCSPAEVTLRVNGNTVTVNGEPLVFHLHHVHSMILEQRDREYWKQGIMAPIRAALILPPERSQVDDPVARDRISQLFQTRAIVNLQGSASLTRLTLTEMTWLDPAVGVVPGNEKADPGNAIAFTATWP